MFNPQIIDQMLHYLKTGLNTPLRNIKSELKNSDKWCPFIHGNETDTNNFLLCKNLKSFISYLEKYCIIYEYLDINVYLFNELKNNIKYIKDPQNSINHKDFMKNMENIISFIKVHNKEVFEKINKLTCEESIRLDEAMIAFKNNLFLSCVIMSVSAIEARLHYLIKHKNIKIYKTFFEKMTLGQLIQLFDENNYKDKKFDNIKKILPIKYKPLIELFNYYRVYSAHPKSKIIDCKIAQSILNLSFSFLLDDETKISNKKLLSCK